MDTKLTNKYFNENALPLRILPVAGAIVTIVGVVFFAGFMGGYDSSSSPVIGIPIMLVGALLLILYLTKKVSAHDIHALTQAYMNEEKARMEEMVTPLKNSAGVSVIIEAYYDFENNAIIKKEGGMLLSSKASVCGIVCQKRQERVSLYLTRFDFLEGTCHQIAETYEFADLNIDYEEINQLAKGVGQKKYRVCIKVNENEQYISLPVDYDTDQMLQTIKNLTASKCK